MPKIDDKQIGVARVYSGALLELAETKGVADQVLEELAELARLTEQDERFATFFLSPLVEQEDRARVLEATFRGRMSDLLVDTLQVMNRKDRLMILPTVAESYRHEHEALRGRVEVYVKSAIPLTDALRGDLRSTVTGFTGREADLFEQVDEKMIGGMVVQIGDKKYDGTVRRQIHHLREVFHDRGREEIYAGRLDATED